MDLVNPAPAARPHGCERSLGKRSCRRWQLLLLGLLAGIGLARCSELSADEILCEEAVGKLTECCGQSAEVAALSCAYSHGSGGCAPTRPSISHPVASCLLDRSCAELRAGGTCSPDGWTEQKLCGTCKSDSAQGGYTSCCSKWKEPLCPGR